MEVPRRAFTCILTCFLLGGFGCCEAQVTISAPPENKTVNRGDDVTISCGYGSATVLSVTWIINRTSFDQQEIVNSPLYRLNSAISPMTLSLTVFSINGTTTFQCVVQSNPVLTTSTCGTVFVLGDVIFITPPENTTVCRGSDVTISCGHVTVPALPVTWIINGTSFDQQEILNSPLYQLNRQSTPTANSLTVFSINATTTFQCIVQSTLDTTSTIGTVTVIDTFTLQNCDVTSPSVGTIRVSCDSSHQIQVTLTCTNNCNEPTMTNNGNSPLIVTGLDPGMYSVTINVFDGNQVVLSNQTEIRAITVMGGNSDGDSGGSSAGAIAGGVIGGIVVVIIIIIVLIIIYYFVSRKNKESTYDDTRNLKSPPGTGGTHASEGDTNVTTLSNAQDDKVVYAAPAQTATIPHQTSASGEQYAVSTKAVNKTSELPSGKYDGVSPDTKIDTQGITYADLQELPIESNRNAADQEAAVTYSQIA